MVNNSKWQTNTNFLAPGHCVYDHSWFVVRVSIIESIATMFSFPFNFQCIVVLIDNL